MSPCMNCPHRKLTCHDHCDEYLEWHDELVLAKEAVHTANQAIVMLVDNYTHRRDLWRRRNKKLGRHL